MIAILNRGISHLRKGTFIGRAQQKLDDYRHERHLRKLQRRETWWRKQAEIAPDVTVDVETDFKMKLSTRSELSRLIYCADFEMQERRFVRAFLRPGDIYVDVGANVGLFSLVAARCVSPTGIVHAFEPCSATFKRLGENLKLNNITCVQPHQAAVSDSAGEVEMQTSLDGYDAWNSLASPVKGNTIGTEKVRCTTYDAFAEESNLVGKVAMMKIDVEGWEAHVLAGGSKVLSRPDAPVLQVEFTDDACATAGTTSAKLYAALEALGYKMYLYDERQQKLVHDPIRAAYPWLNLIGVKDEASVSARLRGKEM